MYFLYILKSVRSKRLYIGYTNDLRSRIVKHNNGLVKSTKPYLLWRIVYYEAYSTKDEAVRRENNLKLRANAWSQLRRRISHSINAD